MNCKLGNIALDCNDVLKLATFWSSVLGRPVDPGASRFFASIGGGDSERTDVAWYFSKVPESKQSKNRMHVDLVNPDPETVVNLMELGATAVGSHEVPGGSHRWTVMQDPEGNEFCIADESFSGWS